MTSLIPMTPLIPRALQIRSWHGPRSNPYRSSIVLTKTMRTLQWNRLQRSVLPAALLLLAMSSDSYSQTLPRGFARVDVVIQGNSLRVDKLRLGRLGCRADDNIDTGVLKEGVTSLGQFDTLEIQSWLAGVDPNEVLGLKNVSQRISNLVLFSPSGKRLGQIPQLPQVTSAHIDDRAFSDDFLEGLPKLESLVVWNSFGKALPSTALPKPRSLRHLSFKGRVSSDYVRSIATWPVDRIELDVRHLSRSDFARLREAQHGRAISHASDSSLAEVIAIPNLEFVEIQLTSNCFADEEFHRGFTALLQKPKLRGLRLYGDQQAIEKAVAKCQNNDQIESLEVSKYHAEMLEYIASLENLLSLKLSGEINSKSVEGLSQLTSLERLTLVNRNNEKNAVGWEHFAFKGMQYLELEGISIWNDELLDPPEFSIREVVLSDVVGAKRFVERVLSSPVTKSVSIPSGLALRLNDIDLKASIRSFLVVQTGIADDEVCLSVSEATNLCRNLRKVPEFRLTLDLLDFQAFKVANKLLLTE